MTLGPFLFGAPLALLGLIALPVIWWVLRATPPTPKDVELPSMRLLDGVDPREETPARTPWWILLIRLAAAALALIGLSQPIYAPNAGNESAGGAPLLIVIDDGWESAPRWGEITGAADAALSTLSRDDAVHILTTADRSRAPNPAQRYTRAEAGRVLSSLEPAAWSPNRDAAADRLEASGLRPARILWASNGLDPATAASFGQALSGLAPLSIYAAPPRGPAAMVALDVDAEAARVDLRRPAIGEPQTIFVSAQTLDGAAIATAEAAFDAQARSATASFELPAAALARVARFSAAGGGSAGLTWLWDTTERSRRVGLVSSGPEAQPLLSDLHYIRKALEPFTILTEGELTDLVLDAPDAIILTDVGRIADADLVAVTEWIEKGGALIRFAGPRLAAQGDELVPTPLRRASRALGGALAWEDPQAIAEFAETSPFAGLSPPVEARISQQVLAQPAPDLNEKTWARLEDGSPLVTAASRGSGMVILFHITAGPDWSDLPYSGVFVDMLRRTIAAGKGEATVQGDGAYTPQLVLDGFGKLQTPDDSAAPLSADAFADTIPSELHPPGYYLGPAGMRALNAAADATPQLVTSWPVGAELLGDAEAVSTDLAGPALVAALILIAIDLFIALGVTGRLPTRRATAAALTLAAVVTLPSADAQTTSEKALEAALDFRLAYVATDDATLDDATAAGLQGLSLVLFRRSSVEPERPHALDLETDALDLYPFIYYAVPENAQPLSETAAARLNAYLRSGGALMIDTRSGSSIADTAITGLEDLLSGLDAPPLRPVPPDHVLTKAFYLLDTFPGRYDGRQLWIEAPATAGETGRGDGVSRLFVGDADWAAAWAADERGRPLFSVDGGDVQREMAYRFGINLIMYVLTGNYKEDQVHLPALLERLGDEDEEADSEDFDLDAIPDLIIDGGPQ